MPAVNRNDLSANIQQTWLNREALEVFEPNLYFWKMGKKPMKQTGYNTLSWIKFDQIATSSVTTGTTSNDGVTPSETDFDGTVVSATPTQYRLVVSMADMVIEFNVVDFLGEAARHVGEAMARKIDAVIQTTVMAGTNVIYGGTQTTRAGLSATDVLTAAKINRAGAKLESLDAPKFDGMYVAIIHPYQLYDLRNDTAAGGWLDMNKYVTPDKIFKGEIGALFGTRVVVSSHVQTFASTVTVYPALVLGKDAYGVGDFQSLRVYQTGGTPSDSDPAAQRYKVAAKVAFGTVILQQNSMVRIETGATAI